ncbi:MAG: hypothetical protein ACRDPY_21885 [Streptosporangiaceae bacterium]
MIEAVRLTKRFGAKTAVDELSFTVRPGLVTGFPRPERGRQDRDRADPRHPDRADLGVRDGRRAALTTGNAAEIRRRIAIMPESPGLYLRLSVAENLECFADLYEVPDALIGSAARCGQST